MVTHNQYHQGQWFSSYLFRILFPGIYASYLVVDWNLILIWKLHATLLSKIYQRHEFFYFVFVGKGQEDIIKTPYWFFRTHPEEESFSYGWFLKMAKPSAVIFMTLRWLLVEDKLTHLLLWQWSLYIFHSISIHSFIFSKDMYQMPTKCQVSW